MIRRLVPIALVSMGAFAAGFPEAASVYNAGLYSQVPLTDVSDANRATFIADAKAAGIDAVWISVVDFFEEEARRKPVLDHLATEIALDALCHLEIVSDLDNLAVTNQNLAHLVETHLRIDYMCVLQ